MRYAVSQSDFVLLCAVLVLCGMGFAALYSIGLGKENGNFTFLYHQAITFGIGAVLLMCISCMHYKTFRGYSILFYVASIMLLVAVLAIGAHIRGMRGWFVFGSLTFQPVELAKLGLILILARYFSAYTRQVGRLRHIITSCLLAVIPIAAVLAQPDLGSAVILFILWFGMILMSGIPRRYTVAMVLMLVIIASAAWFFALKDYQRQRIITFLSPAHDVQGKSYNVHQAQIAIGSGGLLGRGIGYGSQSQLRFLPESQTDFIFSVLAEELGFVGIGFLFFFWFLLLGRFTRLMRRTRDDFAMYCVLGVTLMFFSHMAINIGGNLGLIPLTGIVLPFISYGGSALLIDLVAVGIVESIYIHSA